METFPKVKVTRFNKLEAGELFVFLEDGEPYYAIKTELIEETGESEMVLLGPTFPDGITEAIIRKVDAATIVSYGRDFTVLLPQSPSAWFQSGETRTTVCLAVADEDVFVCVNGANIASQYFPCFLNLRTGALIEGKISQISAFTRSWELAIFAPNLPPISLLKYSIP